MITDYMNPGMGENELNGISALGLAHIGDAVYELMVRSWLCTGGTATARKMHGSAVKLVSAKSQAAVCEELITKLTADELAVFKRGRNTHVNTVPRGATFEEYHMATGLETLFGYLYLSGAASRLNELFEIVIADRKET